MTEFMEQLDAALDKANDWLVTAESDLIHIKLTDVQRAEVDAVIWTLERMKMVYEEMMEVE